MNNLITDYTKSTGLSSGQTYKFKVLAQNAVGESATFTDLEVIAATVPGQVQNIQRAATASPQATEITVSWDAPSSNGGTSITGYKVYYD